MGLPVSFTIQQLNINFPMIDHIIYGKIIIDDIRVGSNSLGRETECGIQRGILGGGGPQAAFGARLWQENVGLVTRSGSDLSSEQLHTLKALEVDLAGWHRFPAIPTPYNKLVQYDENEYLQTGDGALLTRVVDPNAWDALLSQPIVLPDAYRQARTVHLITEFFAEPMVEFALDRRTSGAIFSLEPLIDYQRWKNREALLRLLPQVDIVTPDWPTASGIAGSTDPQKVLAHWATFGPQLVAVRHGERGSYVWSRAEDRMWHVPVLPLDVVDPTGAGNGYGGGLSAGWSAHQDARLAACYGTISARYLVEVVGIPPTVEARRAEALSLVDELMGCVEPL